MAKSVLDAIKMGQWDFELKPTPVNCDSCTEAMPGSKEKADVLAERVRQGLPLWHPADRHSFDEDESSER